MKPSAHPQPADTAYQSLYTLGGVAAWLAAVFILSEVIGLALYPPPNTVSGWFLLFQSNRYIGLLNFWGLEVLLYAMFAIVFLALYVGLRQGRESWMAIALTLALIGVAVFLATNNPFAMLALSNQYAAATTDAQRAMYLAAGEALIAGTNQRAVGGFNLGFFLVSVASLIASSVMRQSHAFSRSTGYVGLLAHAISLADYLRQTLTPSATVALLVILPNALLLVIWYVLVGRRLYQLGAVERKTLPILRRSNRLSGLDRHLFAGARGRRVRYL